MVAQTVGALIQAAAEDLLVVDSGGTLTTNEQNSALDRVQRLVDMAGAARPLIYAERVDLLNLTSSKQSYTIGIDPTGVATADFNVPRPVRIERANLLLTTNVRRPMAVWDFREWSKVCYQQVAGPPKGVYMDAAFASGLATMYFYMIPDQAYQWEFYSWTPAQKITATTDGLDYPPGYAEYWLRALVVRMAPMFGLEPSALQIELLREAKETIASVNCPSPEIRSEMALTTEGGYYNWLSGEEETR